MLAGSRSCGEERGENRATQKSTYGTQPAWSRRAAPCPQGRVEREPSPVAQVSTRELARRAAGYEAREDTEEYFGANYASEPRHQGSAQTLSGWFLAVSPAWYGGISILLSLVLPFVVDNFRAPSTLVVGLILTFGLAKHDGTRLRAAGFDRPPSPAWVLLPVVYFILRVVRTGRSSLAMLLVYLLLQLTLVAIVVLSVLTLVASYSNSSESSVVSSPQSVVPTATTLTQQERDYLLSPAGVDESLRYYFGGVQIGELQCDPFPSTAADTTTTCLVEADGVLYEMILRVTPDFPDTAFVVDTMTPLDADAPGSLVQA